MALVVLAFWAAGRDATLRWAAEKAGAATQGRLVIDGATGSLLGDSRADLVRWQADGLTVAAQGARLAWHPVAAADGRLRIERIEARRLEIDLPAPDPNAESTPIRLGPTLELPMAVGINRFAVDELIVRRAGVEIARLEKIEGGIAADDERIALSGLRFVVLAGSKRIEAKGDASMIPSRPYKTELRLNASTLLPTPGPAKATAQVGAAVASTPASGVVGSETLLKAELRVDGSLDALDARVRTGWAGAGISARTTLHVLDPRPLRQIDIAIADLDLARLATGLPRTLIRGRLAAEMFPAWTGEGARPVFAGPLKIDNELAGPADQGRLPVTALSTVISLTGLRTDLRAIRVSGPAGELTGRGWWAPDGFALEAASEAIQLAGIDSGLQPRSVRAKLSIASSPAASQAANAGLMIDARIADADLDLNLQGRLVDDWFSIARAELALKGDGAVAGQARIEGRMQVRPPFKIDVDGRVSGLSPQRIVRMPPGLFNGRFALSGQAGEPGELRATLELVDSQWQSLPLAGSASARIVLKQFRPERLFDVASSLRWGATRLNVRGSLGHPTSSLGFDLQSEQLAQWGIGLGGQLAANGTLRGRFDAPVLDATLDGRRLSIAAGGLRTTIGEASVVARGLQADQNRFDLDATLSGGIQVSTVDDGPRAAPLVRLATARAKLAGTPDSHRIVVEALGKDQRLNASARGAVVGTGQALQWQGRILDLSVIHPILRMPPPRGRAPSSSAPAPYSSHLAVTQGIDLTIGAGRLEVGGAKIDMQGATLML